MAKEPVIAILDVGKTNKKLFLFNHAYKIVYEGSVRFLETVDEDGFPCEDLESLTTTVFDCVQEILNKEEFELKAINFSTYGASLVYLNYKGERVLPLYNYLKPYPEALKKKFYETYGGVETFTSQTASPDLGSLNSGLQLYRIKVEQPQLFQKIKYALHLPQYLSYLFSGKVATDITSIGCHTGLWDFQKNKYHPWTTKEGIINKFAEIQDSRRVYPAVSGHHYVVGIGLHDSSAALIPYLVSFKEPFVLISTGTWCISLNPFNAQPLSEAELKHNCLCYIQYTGEPVKASRLFAGNEHEVQVKRIAAYFNESSIFYKDIQYQENIASLVQKLDLSELQGKEELILKSIFSKRDLSSFTSAKHAYYQLMRDIVTQQHFSTGLIMNGSIKRIFVDGGFSKNPLYMNMLAEAFPSLEIFAATMPQSTAIGAALAIRDGWNTGAIPSDLIELHCYTNKLG